MKDNITFCIVDDIDNYANDEIKTTITNICDFTISNLYTKGYRVKKGKDEEELLREVETDFAVVMSPGTEFINGFDFFIALESLTTKDFFVAGHVLDRTTHDAYYELHHQCYVINLTYYKRLGYPVIGKLEYNVKHIQLEPKRSNENYHDHHTPLFVSKGINRRTYNNKCHGWNLLRLAFENDLPIIIFDKSIRNNKKHYYPENEQDYYKLLPYIEHKLNFCKNEFVHNTNTEWSNYIAGSYQQIAIPASGPLYLDLVNTGRVIFFDYNKKSLEYWEKNCPRKKNVEYIFLFTNLLTEISLVDHLQADLKTFINLSNIFCYEGTAAKYSLEQRLTAQNQLVNALNNKIKNITINFTIKADDGHR